MIKKIYKTLILSILMISCFNLTVFAEEPTTESVLFHYSTKNLKKLKK